MHAHPELAVLSVLARPLDDERSLFYPDFVTSLLPLVARTALETLMDLRNYKFFNPDLQRAFDNGIAKGKTDGIAEGIAKGELQGKAKMLLKLIALKGRRPSKKQREQILACTDERLLESWADGLLKDIPLAKLLTAEAHPTPRRPPRQ